MTERDLYDAALIEINKLEAPSMLLEDYNYFINKAIQQYINKAYNRYEINQQATDDLMALKNSKSIVVHKFSSKFLNESMYYFGILPKDYMHMLNCIVRFQKDSNIKNGCTQDGSDSAYLATKLTSDVYPSIINNAYFKPSHKRPYYNISEITNADIMAERIINPCLELPSNEEYLVDMILNPCEASDWNGGPVINIKCGDTKNYEPYMIQIDYIKTPKKITITEEKLDWVYRTNEDGTPDEENEKNRPEEMEFSDYVCYEIINEFVKLLLENTADPRLSTNVPINQSIIGEISAE